MSILDSRLAVRAAQGLLKEAMNDPELAVAVFADFVNRAERHLRMASNLLREPMHTGQVRHDLERFTPEGNER
jgi:hypothetical protein